MMIEVTRTTIIFFVLAKGYFSCFRTSGRMSENVLTFKADASDNKARYTCEAKNIMISNTLKAEIDLTVLCKFTDLSHFTPVSITYTR